MIWKYSQGFKKIVMESKQWLKVNGPKSGNCSSGNGWTWAEEFRISKRAQDSGKE